MSIGQLEQEIGTTPLKATKETFTHQRRSQNVEWIRHLPLDGLRYEQVEMQIPLVETSKQERISIQFPGKESLREKNPNIWDFRPKLLGREDSDLTFEEIWDPLFDDLKSIPNAQDRKQISSILATLYYRIAYLVDYQQVPERPYHTTKLWIMRGERTEEEITLGPFWAYHPPMEAVKAVSAIIPDWAGMSFEAFLQYNSLLAWNEDLKIRARFDKPSTAQVDEGGSKSKKREKWSARDPRGRINTLLTYIRVIGFILEEVRPSTLLGGFARQRGMSSASDEEIIRICEPYVKRTEPAARPQKLDSWSSEV